MDDIILDVRHLSTYFLTGSQPVRAVDDLSYTVRRGEFAAIIGESGSGKTVSALSILRLIPYPPGLIMDGSIVFDGVDLTKLSDEEMRKIRGKRISMIFQEPSAALNPVMTVGDQVAEVILRHQDCSKTEAQQRMVDILAKVGIGADRAGDYPHQFSGGMKQRVVIAIALACSPILLIADEPTTALDVTIQAQVLAMMMELRDTLGTAMIMITHDLGIVAQTCDKVAVMYAGEVIEYGTVEDIFTGDRHHPYTVGLFNSIPNLEKDEKRLHPIDGMMPDPTDLPEGCAFSPRCPLPSWRWTGRRRRRPGSSPPDLQRTSLGPPEPGGSPGRPWSGPPIVRPEAAQSSRFRPSWAFTG